MTPTNDTPKWSDAWPVRLAIILALGVALIFSIGVVVGFFGSHSGTRVSPGDILVGAPVVLFAALICWLLIVQIRRLVGMDRRKTGPRTRMAKTLWTFSLALGAVIGAGLVLTSKEKSGSGFDATFRTLLSESAIPSGIAIALLLALAITALITVVYYRNIDEHERAAQGFASTLAINVYILVTLAWWTAAKGGLARPYDAAAAFVLTVFVWFAGWLWQKYR
ncbi:MULTISPECIES: hypothetical protein [unclassified Novosphingobium]|uniref:hypothetical protein n=1 Tax=unclassified Novosphingobium TaxID=2644732 RepID=UPI000EE64E6A|nr:MULTISPECIES: hypothetical protein [unclassified Novosphingobium]HCF25043.1 hypothetical protein [Novosphingobium sp.]HQV02793.1 hypothetical protein [Novosphingobium sp.]